MWNQSSNSLLLIILIHCNIFSVHAYRIFDRNGVVRILAFENESVSIQCQMDMPMNYCGFIHPSGRRYSFSGQGVSNGHCAVKINVTRLDSGHWNCHIGRAADGVESLQTIHLRIVDQVAAIQPNVTGLQGKPVTLECATTKGLIPLRYCRFEPPNGPPFSISSAIKADNPILGKYYFPQNKSIDRGDCAVTICKVNYEHEGLWTCGAGFDDDGQEHSDKIMLVVKLSLTGWITFSVIGVAAFLCILGIVVWKKRQFLVTTHLEVPEVIDIDE